MESQDKKSSGNAPILQGAAGAASTSGASSASTTNDGSSTSRAIERKPKTDHELRDIMKTLMDNPESIADIPDEDIIELKQRINPIGTFAPMQKSYAVESIINMKEQDMRKFLMTAMIGFIYRRLEEYTPDYVVRIEDMYATKINGITTGERVQERRDELRAECTKITSEYKQANQKAIRAFLDSIFCFDPDKHVRRAPAELPINALDIIAPDAEDEDDKIKPAATAAAAAVAKETSSAVAEKAPAALAAPSTSAAKPVQELSVTREALADATEVLRKEVTKYASAAKKHRSKAKKDPATRKAIAHDVEQAAYESAEIVYRSARIVSGNLAQGYRVISDEINALQSYAAADPTARSLGSLEDARQLLQKCRGRLDEAADLVGPYVAGRTLLEAKNALQVAPPADVFYHFGRYVDSHYEVLRILTNVIYQTPPGIENAVIYYDTFDQLEKAKEYIRIHEAEFRADPKIIENGGVTVLGPFRENREMIDFYNRNTEVLRLMMEQTAKDQQLGKDLTKKRITKSKRKNIHEAGADDPGLEKYVAARGIISQFGKKPELTRTEREQLVRAEQDRAEYETPDGALAIRVLAPTLDERGVPTDLKQTFFYSEAANIAAGNKTSAPGAPGAPAADGKK